MGDEFGGGDAGRRGREVGVEEIEMLGERETCWDNDEEEETASTVPSRIC